MYSEPSLAILWAAPAAPSTLFAVPTMDCCTEKNVKTIDKPAVNSQAEPMAPTIVPVIAAAVRFIDYSDRSTSFASPCGRSLNHYATACSIRSMKTKPGPIRRFLRLIGNVFYYQGPGREIESAGVGCCCLVSLATIAGVSIVLAWLVVRWMI